MTSGESEVDERSEVPAWERLIGLVTGGQAAQVVGLALRAGLIDGIGDGVRERDEIAMEFGYLPDTTTRFLRCLVALDVLTEPAPGRFALGSVGRLLRRDRPGSLHALAAMVTDPAMSTAWQRLDFSLRTGRAAFDEVFGTDFFTHLASDPELADLYNVAMTQGTLGVAGALSEHYDFGRRESVVDVGGGNGTLLAVVLRANPGLRGVLHDSGAGAASAKEHLREAGVLDRCEIRVGDFFLEVPGGRDLYLLKSIVHGWDDDRACVILNNCAQAMTPSGTVLLVEQVLPDAPGRNPTERLNDLNMLVNGGGRERTLDEFVRLCSRAGLSVSRTLALPATGFHVIEAVRTR